MPSPRLLVLLCGLVLGWMSCASATAALQSWTSSTGEVTEGALLDYSWADHQMTLDTAAGQQIVLADQLTLFSKLQLFISQPFREAYQANMEVIQEGPYYETRSKELKTIFMVLCITYAFTLLSVSWVLASWVMRNGNAGPLLKALALYAFLTACAVFLIRHFVPDFDPLGQHQTAALTGLGIYCIFFVLLAMWIFKTSFGRAFSWCLLTTLAMLILPISMLISGISAQVYKMEGEMTLPSTDKYLTETWFEPLGLL